MTFTRNYRVYILLVLVVVSGVAGYIETPRFENPEEPTVYCYQCNSGIDLDCENLQPPDSAKYHYKPCLDIEKYNGTLPFCRKITQRIFARNDLERVIRKCGWVKHPRLDCYNVRNEDHIETICQCFESGCNGSSGLRHSLASITAVLLAQCSLRTFFTDY